MGTVLTQPFLCLNRYKQNDRTAYIICCHDCLLPTHQAVLDTYEKVKKFAVIDGFLTKASGCQFYNTSRFTFEAMLTEADSIEANFRD